MLLEHDLQKHKECVRGAAHCNGRVAPVRASGPQQNRSLVTSQGEGLKVTTPSRATPAHPYYLPLLYQP